MRSKHKFICTIHSTSENIFIDSACISNIIATSIEIPKCYELFCKSYGLKRQNKTTTIATQKTRFYGRIKYQCSFRWRHHSCCSWQCEDRPNVCFSFVSHYSWVCGLFAHHHFCSIWPMITALQIYSAILCCCTGQYVVVCVFFFLIQHRCLVFRA